MANRKHSTAAAKTNPDTSLLIFSLQVRHITSENKYRGLLLSTGNFMRTFWSSFPVLTATMTKPNIRRKTNPRDRKAFLQISYEERLPLRVNRF